LVQIDPHAHVIGLPPELDEYFHGTRLGVMALKILAVDDEPGVLNLLKTMVEPLGYEVVTLADSRQAALRIEDEKFDGILLDVLMPHLDGFELTRRIRSSRLNFGVPIVMLTSLNDVGTMRKGFTLGVTFFLGKPFTRERIYGLFKAARGSFLREKRLRARLPFRTTVKCKIGQFGERQFRSGSLDIGVGGLLLEPSGGLDVGQELFLEFMLPPGSATMAPVEDKPRKSLFHDAPAREEEPRQVRAKVVYREPPDRIAVEFVLPPADVLEAIQRYITADVR
jgi:CheY-like chemotaxis protein